MRDMARTIARQLSGSAVTGCRSQVMEAQRAASWLRCATAAMTAASAFGLGVVVTALAWPCAWLEPLDPQHAETPPFDWQAFMWDWLAEVLAIGFALGIAAGSSQWFGMRTAHTRRHLELAVVLAVPIGFAAAWMIHAS